MTPAAKRVQKKSKHHLTPDLRSERVTQAVYCRGWTRVDFPLVSEALLCLSVSVCVSVHAPPVGTALKRQVSLNDYVEREKI